MRVYLFKMTFSVMFDFRSKLPIIEGLYCYRYIFGNSQLLRGYRGYEKMNMVRVKVNTYQHFRLWRLFCKCKHTPIYWAFTGHKSIKAQNTNFKNGYKIKILLHLFRFSDSSIQKWNWFFSRICDGSEKIFFYSIVNDLLQNTI